MTQHPLYTTDTTMSLVATPYLYHHQSLSHSRSHSDHTNQNHSRSHSDPTKNQSSGSGFHHLKTPDSDCRKMSLESSSTPLKRRRLDLRTDVESDGEIYSYKKSRTAPSSPPYDLTLKSPLLQSAKFMLNTPMPSSDPIAESVATTVSPVKSSSAMVDSIEEYPDTCYRYSASAALDKVSEHEDPYNQEWKQRLEILVKADDPVIYSKFKDYCKEVSKSPLQTHVVTFNSKISKRIQKTTNKKLADIIASRYQQNEKMKISSIINFPFENNYTYQSTGYLKDIDTLTHNHELYRRNSSINLSKYNHIFSKMTNEDEMVLDANRKRLLQQQRRKSKGESMETGLVTTDLPFNFSSSSKDRFAPNYQAEHKFVNTVQVKNPKTPATPRQTLLPSPATSPSSKFSVTSSGNHYHVRTCISCKSVQSPCWRPSWSISSGQLCNSCGLRYKKTGAHCLNEKCLRIPAKGEWTLMKNRGKLEFFDSKTNTMKHCYKCLHCGGEVEVNE